MVMLTMHAVIFGSVIFISHITSLANGQLCLPHNEMSVEKAAASSEILVEAMTLAKVDRVGKGSNQVYNVTAKVVTVFPYSRGKIKKNVNITFGPGGKAKPCEDVKLGKKYILFLQNSVDGHFYWNQFNPIKSTGKIKKKLRCKTCLLPPKFKKESAMFKKQVGQKLRIKCKASGKKPKPSISWYYNDVLLNSTNKPQEFSIKTKKSGGSGSLTVRNIKPKHNGSHFICRAMNEVIQLDANYSVTLVVVAKQEHQKTCSKKECDPAIHPSTFCGNHGYCCLESDGNPLCKCLDGYTGPRCSQKPKPTVKFGGGLNLSPNELERQQQLIAILGMALALVVIILVCICVYYLFKRRKHGSTSSPRSG
ncbi:pro-neuregulin-2, membrane-bound isoform-like [Clavelina lepadiformis]|uniref:pro-neuregulin-2, membrane-bound isoform-like n=1 Tax=Clavelina lepadiformis TaxID=159417 RepID=UPI004042C799